MMELHETGKVRMLCVTSPKRLVAFPSLPTAVEAGLPNMVAQNFIGLFAPAKTPKEIIDQLAQVTRAAMADPQFRQAFVSSGFDPYPDSTPEATQQFVEAEIARWTPIIKSIGLKLD
jgi:tripartite-type tricarboxylate transporter receptor subunit TctC